MKGYFQQSLLDILWIFETFKGFTGIGLETNRRSDRAWSKDQARDLGAFIFGAKDTGIAR